MKLQKAIDELNRSIKVAYNKNKVKCEPLVYAKEDNKIKDRGEMCLSKSV